MTDRHIIQPRRVQFDLKNSPLHWLPGDLYSSHIINSINLLLPPGELWFCRVYNKALPMVSDAKLAADVRGFIRQEAIHARVHSNAELYLQAHGVETESIRGKAEWLFEQFLGEAPFGIKALKTRAFEKRWLIIRVGLIAAIEHFTGMLGQWCMDNTSWDNGDPIVVDMFRWHLAEEVEHRNVAFDLFEHLCRTQLGFYASRQALMAITFPLFIYYLMEGGRALAKQDGARYSQRMSKMSLLRLLFELERMGRKTENVPTFGYLFAGTLRWISPRFHPEYEGNTQQALNYLARSPAAQAAMAA